MKNILDIHKTEDILVCLPEDRPMLISYGVYEIYASCDWSSDPLKCCKPIIRQKYDESFRDFLYRYIEFHLYDCEMEDLIKSLGKIKF